MEQLSHATHWAVNVGEKSLVPLAQYVESRLAVLCSQQTVFRTATITHKAHPAFSALVRQIGFFIPPKLALLRQVD